MRDVFYATLCVTHRCNLDCTYCYQNHDNNSEMSFDTGKEVVNKILKDHTKGFTSIEISFIGGEPLIRFDLIKQIYEYVNGHKGNQQVTFSASTNGTLLNDEMKKWFSLHKDNFILGLSIDGEPNSQNHNRSNSFNKIDIPFFVNNWPHQGVKLTISDYSISFLADNIKFLYSMGFENIEGVNLAEDTVDWSSDYYLYALAKQLKILSDYYVEHPEVKLDQTFAKDLVLCVLKKKKRKYCGSGENVSFYDYNGEEYPCPFFTPLSFSKDDLKEIMKIDFSNADLFIDNDCFSQCLIYPICNTCAGANYKQNQDISCRDKSRCNLMKLTALYIANMHAERIINHRELYKDETHLFYLIEAIKKIRSAYLDEFQKFMM